MPAVSSLMLFAGSLKVGRWRALVRIENRIVRVGTPLSASQPRSKLAGTKLRLIIGYMESAADEEGIQTKLVPKHAEAAAKSGAAGGLGAFVPAVLVLALAAAAYFFLNKA